jgi:hypothetical protein
MGSVHEVREADGPLLRVGPHAVAAVRRRVALDRQLRNKFTIESVLQEFGLTD